MWGRWRHGSQARAQRRFRVEIINENTLERVFAARFRGVRVLLAALGAAAALASLVAVIFMFTPLGKLLPGQLRGDLRGRYVEMALRVDSLEMEARRQHAYMSNIMDILTDSVPTAAPADGLQPKASAMVDTLLRAGEAEQRFVKQFDADSRFDLSVLSPIAGEGMIFVSPMSTDTGAGPASAVYRGTVVAVTTADNGLSTVVVQHPGEFISVYADLAEVYVDRGDKVVGGQRIGLATPARPLLFELWHSGVRLDPAKYIPY